MGLLHRRAPLYGRPLPFLAGAFLAVAGLFVGSGWSWQWSLQTGNVFLLLTFPKSVVAPDPLHLGFLLVGVLGMLLMARVGLRDERATRAFVAIGDWSWRRPKFRFYPMTLMFGLFLVFFGATFLFDASVYGDTPPQGFAAFLYFDYAGLLDRPVMTGAGVLVLAVGITCSTTLAFERGLGISAAPPPPVQPFAAATPTRSAPPIPAATPRSGFIARSPRDVLPRRNAEEATPPMGVRARLPNQHLQQVRLREDPKGFPRLRDQDRGRIL